MKPASVTTPDLSEAGVKAGTGKTLNQWFQLMDEFGGLARGRRELNNLLYVEHKLDPWWYSTLVVEYEARCGAVEKDGRPRGFMVCATKTVNAGADAAYEAFTTGEALSRWFGDDSQVDLRVGGTFSNADGDRGNLKKLRPGKEIAFSWEQPRHTPGTSVSVTFPPKSESKCTVTVTHDRIQTRSEADELRATWLQALDRLKLLLEA